VSLANEAGLNRTWAIENGVASIHLLTSPAARIIPDPCAVSFIVLNGLSESLP
jgi:hypothetical protein